MIEQEKYRRSRRSCNPALIPSRYWGNDI